VVVDPAIGSARFPLFTYRVGISFQVIWINSRTIAAFLICIGTYNLIQEIRAEQGLFSVRPRVCENYFEFFVDGATLHFKP